MADGLYLAMIDNAILVQKDVLVQHRAQFQAFEARALARIAKLEALKARITPNIEDVIADFEDVMQDSRV